MLWLFCKSCRKSLHACHAGKKCFFPEIFGNSVIFKKIFKNPDYTTCLFFKCLQHSSKYTGWTEFRACCTAVALTFHCIVEIFWPFLSNYPFFHFFWKILQHVLLVFNFKKMESTQSKMNKRATTRIILFIQPWQGKHLGWRKC